MIWWVSRKNQIRERVIGWNRWLFINSSMCQQKPWWAILHLQTWLMDKASGNLNAIKPTHTRGWRLLRIRNSLRGRVNQWWQCKLLDPSQKHLEVLWWLRWKRICLIRETQAWSLGWEDPPEKGRATHSDILAWRILWTEEPGGLQPTGSQTVRHNWTTFKSTFKSNSQFNRAQSLKANLGIQD